MDSGDLASDIITYVGVPLAVAGLLPILWSSIATFLAWRKIKAKLKRNNISAITRSDAFTRTIEVQYVKYTVTCNSRLGYESDHRQRALHPAETRRVCREDHPDYIAGGTWAILNWEKQQIGQISQRIQHAEELRQPQVDINFQELVAHLYDLGAVPDNTGWTKLLQNGLWTAPKTPLMNSPEDSKKPLLVTASFDHSEGHLSLALTQHWADTWAPPRQSSVSPYSICLPATRIQGAGDPNRSNAPFTTSAAFSKTDSNEKVMCDHNEGKLGLSGHAEMQYVSADIICEISAAGLAGVHVKRLETDIGADARSVIPWGHLRIRKGKFNDGIWFASIATASGVSSETILWKYKIPEEISQFAASSTIPCGVAELLGFVDDSMTPSWMTVDLTHEHERLISSRRIADQVMAERAERGMSDDERLLASKGRRERDYIRERDERKTQRLREDEARGLRVSDALRSPTWTAARVADHGLLWLQARGHFPDASTVKDAVLVILRQMLLEKEDSASICACLARWKDWASKGGMRVDDLHFVERSPDTFAKAILLMAVIMDFMVQYEDTVLDLEECVNSWENVRLG